VNSLPFCQRNFELERERSRRNQAAVLRKLGREWSNVFWLRSTALVFFFGWSALALAPGLRGRFRSARRSYYGNVDPEAGWGRQRARSPRTTWHESRRGAVRRSARWWARRSSRASVLCFRAESNHSVRSRRLWPRRPSAAVRLSSADHAAVHSLAALDHTPSIVAASLADVWGPRVRRLTLVRSIGSTPSKIGCSGVQY
jgi:hypothetical protein